MRQRKSGGAQILYELRDALLAACPKCGAAVEPDEEFCEECGIALTDAAPAAANSTQSVRVRKRTHREVLRELRSSIGGSVAVAVKQPPTSAIPFVEAADTEALEGERKTVTALFADPKGSTLRR
jgi:hypothetical protein